MNASSPAESKSPRAHANGASQARPTLASPLDGAPRESVPAADAGAVREAVACSSAAQSEWAHTSLEHRVACLRRAAKRMLAFRREAVALVREEVGKGESEGIFNEALGPLEAVNGWARIVAREAKPSPVRLNPLSFPKKSARVELVPRGVVGVIAPWNYPIAGLYRAVIPALLTGNGVVLKPSERSPRSSAWFVDELARDLPKGLVSVVQGDGQVGEALVLAGIDACVFTGSVRAGARVRALCAERGIPSSVEMGGKDAAVVLDDCDLDRTVTGITHWALSNAGQACGAIEVAYVDERIADAFVARMTDAFRALRTHGAPGAGEDPEIGPLGNEQQLKIVEAHVADALAKGARLACGGARTGVGFGYLPTLLDGCSARMDVVREETFGPVLAVVRVRGVEEAVRLVNQSPYGLGASVWTRDLARGERIAERLDVGVAIVNNHAFTGAVPELPWSGTRATGFGVANSRHALATFARPKAIVVDASSAPEPFFMPYDGALRDLGHTLADAQIGRFGGAWKLPFLLRQRVATVRSFFSARKR